MEDMTVRTEWDPASGGAPTSKRGYALVGLLVAAAGALGWLLLRDRTRTRRVAKRLPKLGAALRRASEHPERVARPDPNGFKKILTSAGSVAASVIAKKIAARAFDRYVARPAR